VWWGDNVVSRQIRSSRKFERKLGSIGDQTLPKAPPDHREKLIAINFPVSAVSQVSPQNDQLQGISLTLKNRISKDFDISIWHRELHRNFG